MRRGCSFVHLFICSLHVIRVPNPNLRGLPAAGSAASVGGSYGLAGADSFPEAMRRGRRFRRFRSRRAEHPAVQARHTQIVDVASLVKSEVRWVYAA